MFTLSWGVAGIRREAELIGRTRGRQSFLNALTAAKTPEPKPTKPAEQTKCRSTRFGAPGNRESNEIGSLKQQCSDCIPFFRQFQEPSVRLKQGVIRSCGLDFRRGLFLYCPYAVGPPVPDDTDSIRHVNNVNGVVMMGQRRLSGKK